MGMSTRKAVVQNERAWQEQEAVRRQGLDALLYAAPAFDAVVQPSLDFLQAVAPAWVLDLGGGEGKETVALAARGLRTVCLDLSDRQLHRARELVRAQAPAGRVVFVQANAEELPFAADSLTAVYGKAVLHHLDLELAGDELRRVLRAGGRAALAEPLAGHPLFWLARRLTPGLRTRDEHPLEPADLARFAQPFADQEAEAHLLTAPLAFGLRLLPAGEGLFRRVYAGLGRLDAWLLRRFPSLGRWAWYGVIKVSR